QNLSPGALAPFGGGRPRVCAADPPPLSTAARRSVGIPDCGCHQRPRLAHRARPTPLLNFWSRDQYATIARWAPSRAAEKNGVQPDVQTCTENPSRDRKTAVLPPTRDRFESKGPG